MNSDTLWLAPVRRSSQMEDAAYQSVVEAKVNSLTAQVGFHKAQFLLALNGLIDRWHH